VSWFNNFIGRLSLATKPRPQQLANFIDRLTAPLDSAAGVMFSCHRPCVRLSTCLYVQQHIRALRGFVNLLTQYLVGYALQDFHQTS